MSDFQSLNAQRISDMDLIRLSLPWDNLVAQGADCANLDALVTIAHNYGIILGTEISGGSFR